MMDNFARVVARSAGEYCAPQLASATIPTFFSEARLLTLVWALLSWHWLSGFKLIPYDAYEEFYGVAHYVARLLHAGELPWWNLYQYSGTPLFADPQSLLFTAFTPIGALFGATFSPLIFNWIELAHLLAGGLALLAFLRSSPETTQLRRLVGVCVFMFAGVATSRLQHVPQIVTYAYLPIALWLAGRLMDRVTWGSVLPLAGIIALICCNPNQVTFLGGIAVGALIMLRMIETRPAKPFRVLALLLFAVLLGLALAAPVLTAVTEFATVSNRPAFTIADSVPSSFHGFSFLAYGFPGVFGTGGFSGTHWSTNDITENWLFLGTPVLLLLAAGVRGMRDCYCAGLLVGIIFFTAFAMGSNTPIYPWLFAHVPGFGLFRRPSDAAYVLMLLAALLVARQRDTAWFDARRTRVLVCVLPIVVMALVVLSSGLLSWVAQKGAIRAFETSALIASVRYVAIAALFMWMLARMREPARNTQRWLLAALLLAAFDMAAPVRFGEFVGFSRSWHIGQYYRQQFDREGGRDVNRLVQWLRDHQTVGANAPYRIETTVGSLASGFVSVAQIGSSQGYAPIRMSAYQNRIGAGAGNWSQTFAGLAKGYNSPWFQAIGLKYVLLPMRPMQPGIDLTEYHYFTRIPRDNLATSAQLEKFTGIGYEIWRLPNPFPPMRLVSDARLAASEPTGHESDLGQCELQSRTGSTFTGNCTATAAAVVVLTEIAHPGWYACVDGKLASAQTAWGLVRAVPIPAGRHTVKFVFEPSPLFRWRRCERDLLD